jgi:hypothetical protein
MIRKFVIQLSISCLRYNFQPVTGGRTGQTAVVSGILSLAHSSALSGPYGRVDRDQRGAYALGGVRLYPRGRGCGWYAQCHASHAVDHAFVRARQLPHGKAGGCDGRDRVAAGIAQAHDFVLTLRHRHETAMGERVLQLGGRQRQRIAVRRRAAGCPHPGSRLRRLRLPRRLRSRIRV